MPDAISPAQRRVLRTMYDREWWHWRDLDAQYRRLYPGSIRGVGTPTLRALECDRLIERGEVLVGDLWRGSVYTLTNKGLDAADRIIAEEGEFPKH